MQSERTTGLRKLAPVQKAARLVAQGRVHREPLAEVFTVEGSTGTYLVIHTTQEITCTCPARVSLCSHVLAVLATPPERSPDIEDIWRRVQAPLGEVA